MESNENIHTEALDNLVKRIEKQMKDLNVHDIILLGEAEPDLNKHYGGTAESIEYWE